MIYILLAIIIALQVYQFFTNKRKNIIDNIIDNLSDGDIESKLNEIAKEKLDDLIDNNFTYLDCKKEVFDVIISMRFNPDEWCTGSNHTIEHEPSGIQIWTSNDVESRRFYDPEHKDIVLTALEKKIIDKCCRQVRRWSGEKAREISEIIDNKFVS